jgi:hypothetical protein
MTFAVPVAQRGRADPAYIAQCLRVFAGPDEVVELRILGVDRKGTVAGYYDDHGKLAADAVKFDGRGQIYFTLNALDPALVGRYCNRLEEWAKVTTADKDVTRRRWLFLDFDPTRPAGVSANDGEKAAARAVMQTCREWLKSQGWPEPVLGDSGNGWHLLYRIDLPNDDDARQLLEKCLVALSFTFSDGGVKVDETTFNAARICKLYGVLASKGDDTTGKSKQPPRPHRYSRLVKVPEPVEAVPLALLEALAATLPKAETDGQAHQRNGGKRSGAGSDEIADYLRRNGLDVAFDGAWGDGAHKWVLKRCPWNEAHTNRSAYVIRMKNGAMVARCHHDGCHGKEWRDMPGDRPGAGSPTVGNVGRKKRVRLLPPFQPFPLEALPPVLCEYVVAAAQSIGCDPALVALPALAVVAGAVGNARALTLKKGWSEPAVVWSMTVAESGGHKSPAYHAAVNPLMELQCDDFDAHQEAVLKYNNELCEWNTQKKEERGEKPKEPKEPPSYIASDTTIETVGELLRDSPKGLLVARDELDGWFGSFTRYKKGGGGSDRPHWLELHRAGTLRVDRMTRERGKLVVRRACASITGTIQPAVLARALDPEALQAGLGARFLLAMPPGKQRVWTEAEVADELAERYRQLLRALLTLPVENVTKRLPRFLGLSQLAKEAWVRFYNEWGHVQYQAEGEQASAFAKIEAYAPRLALLHHCVSHAAAGTNDRCSVLQGSMRAGIALARWFANEVTRVYSMLREDEEQRQTRKLVEWIADHGKPTGDGAAARITVRDLQRSNSRRWPSNEAAEAGLESLLGMGLGRWVEGPAPEGGGHRPRWFELTRPTPDTSDTRPDTGDGSPSDTRADTRPDGRAAGRPVGDGSDDGESSSEDFGAVGDERVSEVSAVEQGADSGDELPD